MEHVQEEELIRHRYDGTALSAAASSHVAACAACQARLDTLQRMHDELAISRRSTVDPSQTTRYVALFSEVNVESRHALARLGAWLRAGLTWDSRSQPLPAGVRTAGATSYRLLYAAAAWEVEMLVESVNGVRRIEGEFVGEDDSAQHVLVELVPVQEGVPELSVESSADGRFQIDRVAPGNYRVTFTPVHGPVIEIQQLALT